MTRVIFRYPLRKWVPPIVVGSCLNYGEKCAVCFGPAPSQKFLCVPLVGNRLTQYKCDSIVRLSIGLARDTA